MTDVVSIKNFILNFAISNPSFDGAQGLTQYLQKLSFSQVANVLTKEDTYTPNNDYRYIWQSIPAGSAPNFIFIQTPGILNLCVTVGGQPVINALPVNKCIFIPLPPGGPIVDSIYIEGRPGTAAYPMAQGTPVDYFCLMAQAQF